MRRWAPVEERSYMFGIDDPWVFSGYMLSIACTVIAVIYGWWKWNEEVD